jgi:hypothetical protein
MAFEEFKKREWIVLKEPEPGVDAKHSAGDIVSFDENPEGVINVRCKRYGDATYAPPEGNDPEGTIQANGFVIRMIEKSSTGKRRIRCEPLTGEVGGSWTAEDTGSGGGGDG